MKAAVFIAIRWRRYATPRPGRCKREWTAARLRAADQFVKREKAKTPLFPELAPVQSVADRVADIDAYEAEFRRRMRQHQAEEWRRARKQLRSLPPITQHGILRYWAQSGFPPDPLYLNNVLRDERMGISPWTKLRKLHELRLRGRKASCFPSERQIAA